MAFPSRSGQRQLKPDCRPWGRMQERYDKLLTDMDAAIRDMDMRMQGARASLSRPAPRPLPWPAEKAPGQAPIPKARRGRKPSEEVAARRRELTERDARIVRDYAAGDDVDEISVREGVSTKAIRRMCRGTERRIIRPA